MNSSLRLRFLLVVMLALALASCGGADSAKPATTLTPPEQTSSPTVPQGQTSAPPTTPEQSPEPTHHLEETLEPGDLVLSGANAGGRYPTDATLDFVLLTSTYDVEPREVELTINGVPVKPAFIRIEDKHQILAFVKLVDGRNELKFKAYGQSGLPVFLEETIWAGSNKMQVEIVDASGARVNGEVKLKLRLADDREAVEERTIVGGHAEFTNIPGRPVILEARSFDNSMGAMAANGGAGQVTLRLTRFNEPSAIDNNDLSKGLAGWTYGSSVVTLVPHVEDVGPASAPHSDLDKQAPSAGIVHSTPISRASQQSQAPAGTNMDMALSTAGDGQQTLSRTFTIKPGTSSVSVRYRFVVGDSYVDADGDSGPTYNFFYSVSARSSRGEFTIDSNTDKSLGHGAFDKNGSTAWKTVRLETSKEGDTVQIDLIVARAAECLQDGTLIVDVIREKDEVTPDLSWDPNAGGLRIGYKVGKRQLENDVSISVYWASGKAYSDRIGDAIQSIVVPAGTAAGAVGSQNLPGSLLQNDPDATTHLIAVVSEDAVGPVADPQIVYGPNAVAAAVSAEMRDAVRDGLRSAGTKRGVISRSVATAADQARVMFENLTNSKRTLPLSIAYQLKQYGPHGDAVIRVFENQTRGMAIEQIQTNARAIKSAMLDEINAQGPALVSNHCVDPSKLSVVDVPWTNFSSLTARGLFGRVAHERSTVLEENDVFHMEIKKR